MRLTLCSQNVITIQNEEGSNIQRFCAGNLFCMKLKLGGYSLNE